MSTRMDAGDEGLDRDGDDRRGGKGARGAARRKLLSDEIFQKIDYKNPQELRSFVTDRGKMIPRRISGASARQQRVILLGGLPRAHARVAAVLGDRRLVMAMQIILTQDVANLGKAGELVSVKPGYGRNYLVPNGMAVTATVSNKNRLEHEKAVIGRRVAKELAPANEIATRINGMTLQFERNVGEGSPLKIKRGLNALWNKGGLQYAPPVR